MGKFLAKKELERSGGDRESLVTLLPVSLEVERVKGEKSSISGCLFDVSVEGLCVLLREDLPEGATATLVTLNGRIAFVVAWVQKDSDRAYRCGLRLAQEHGDLRDLMTRYISPTIPVRKVVAG